MAKLTLFSLNLRVKLTSAVIVYAFGILHCFTTHVHVPKVIKKKLTNTCLVEHFFCCCLLFDEKLNKNSMRSWNCFCNGVTIVYSVCS